VLKAVTSIEPLEKNLKSQNVFGIFTALEQDIFIPLADIVFFECCKNAKYAFIFFFKCRIVELKCSADFVEV